MRAVAVSDIVSMLSARAEAVCRQLFPAGTVVNKSFAIGSVDGEPGQSLRVYLAGRKPGNWRDFAEADGTPRGQGDILDLIAQAACGGDKGAAVRWAKHFLGLERPGKDALSAEEMRRRQAQARAAVKRRERQAAKDAAGKRSAAWFRWNEATPELAGTPVDLYLKGRGIDIAQLSSHNALRYHPELPASETGELLPAMIAAIAGPDPKIAGRWRFAGVHRTYLDADGAGGFVKAPSLKEPKVSLGAVMGSHIGIAKGATGRPIGKAGEDETLLICEGIENGLTYKLACPDLRIVAAITLGNMAAIVLPRVKTLILAREPDTHPQAIRGFERAVAFQMERCDDVRVAEPLAQRDANAYLMEAHP